MNLFRNLLNKIINETTKTRSQNDYIYSKKEKETVYNRQLEKKETKIYTLFSTYYKDIESEGYKKVFVLNQPNPTYVLQTVRGKGKVPFFYGVKPVEYSSAKSSLADDFKNLKNPENLDLVNNLSVIEEILKKTFPFEVVEKHVKDSTKIVLLRVGSSSPLNNITSKILTKLLKEEFPLQVEYVTDLKDYALEIPKRKAFYISPNARWNPRDCKSGEPCVRSWLKDFVNWNTYDDFYNKHSTEAYKKNPELFSNKDETTILGNAKKVDEFERFMSSWIESNRGKSQVEFKVSNVQVPGSKKTVNLRGGFRRFIKPIYYAPDEIENDSNNFYILIDNSIHSGETIKQVIKVLPAHLLSEKKIIGYALAAETEHSSLQSKLKKY